MSIRPEIAERLRRAIPANHSIVPDSLPVISFGDAFSAEVATIALNPSWREFWDKGNIWRDGDKRRLESLRSLGVANARDLTDAHLEQVIERSNAYFRHQPYRTWFNPLNTILKDVTGADYYAGTACHLDLVQWATDKVQKNLAGTWSALVAADRSFLAWQIKTTSAEIVVLNGKTVVEALTAEEVVPPLATITLPYNSSNGPRRITVYSGSAHGKTFIGWNVTVAYGIPKAIRSEFLNALRTAAGR